MKPQSHLQVLATLDRNDNPIPPTCTHCGQPEELCAGTGWYGETWFFFCCGKRQRRDASQAASFCRTCEKIHNRPLQQSSQVAEVKPVPRRSQPSTRNPILAMPEAHAFLDLRPETLEYLVRLLKALSVQCHANAERAWAKKKGPMAAYWRSNAVFARHIANAIRRIIRENP